MEKVRRVVAITQVRPVSTTLAAVTTVAEVIMGAERVITVAEAVAMVEAAEPAVVEAVIESHK